MLDPQRAELTVDRRRIVATNGAIADPHRSGRGRGRGRGRVGPSSSHAIGTSTGPPPSSVTFTIGGPASSRTGLRLLAEHPRLPAAILTLDDGPPALIEALRARTRVIAAPRLDDDRVLASPAQLG